MSRKLIALFTVALLLLAALPAQAQEPAICGTPQVYTLWGGKTINVGSVTVSNDETNLYVKYETTGGWYLKEVHLYVLDYEPMVRLTPGGAPYKSGDIAYTTSYTFTVPLGDIECGTTLWLQAHASVAMLDGEGNEIQGETAYGGDITDPPQGSWYGNIRYVVQCCEEEPCFEFMDETAWAAGTRYVTRGNWATFTPYVPGSTVNLYAGQTMLAGTVYFSAPVDGWVTITITLTPPWEFAPVSENIKVQDYEFAPSGNPSPGLFAWKTTAPPATITVPLNNFYGVHADVGYWVEVECPVE